MSKRILYVTPKAYSQIMESEDLKEKFSDYKIVATHYIYMNMMGGWTEEECDNVAYSAPDIENANYLDFVESRNMEWSQAVKKEVDEATKRIMKRLSDDIE